MLKIGVIVLTHVTGQHGLLLSAVERELERPLDDDAIVDRHGSVKRGLDSRREVDESGDGPIRDMNARLTKVRSTMPACGS